MVAQAGPAALVLAAGAARRFGRDKRWVRLAGGRLMIDQVLEHIAAAGLAARVVLRADDAIGLAHPWPVPVLAVAPAQAAAGMGASLAAAVHQWPDDQPCLICLADMPFILPDTYRTLAAALTADAIVVPTYRGERGHPVGFAARFLPALRALGGERGARVVLDAHRQCVREIPVDDPGVRQDIDTVADLLLSAGGGGEQQL
jgi:molybdenum cofactor cytidylyltransferase